MMKGRPEIVLRIMRRLFRLMVEELLAIYILEQAKDALCEKAKCFVDILDTIHWFVPYQWSAVICPVPLLPRIVRLGTVLLARGYTATTRSAFLQEMVKT